MMMTVMTIIMKTNDRASERAKQKVNFYFSLSIFRICAIHVHKATDIWPVSSILASV